MDKINKNIYFNIEFNIGIHWTNIEFEGCSAWVKGYAFYKENLYEKEAFASLIAKYLIDLPKNDQYNQFKKFLLDLNGNYAIVIIIDKCLFASVDRVRSIPLFYGQTDNEFYLSDNADWVRQQVGDTDMDDLSMKEFMLTGYVTGSDTLYPNVKQLQAGECLYVNNIEDKIELKTNRYYQWIHGDYSNATEQELCEEMDQMHIRVFERLLESTKNRTLVVPLSGGYDSRLIVTMLKRLGRENVICFSYGRPENWESEISKKVAEQLGYQWLFVPYSRKSWYRWYHCDEMQSYIKYGSGLTSIAHIQDWPAVWQLKKQNLIPEDSVFVPGHSGDFTAGSHIPLHWNEDSKLEIHDLYNAMIKKHYNLWDIKYKNFISLFENKFSDIISQFRLSTSADYANAFEFWDWQERQAKFIINSVRVYEYWGYDWRIPLWDNEILDYWSKIPFDYRIGKKLYILYLKNQFEFVELKYTSRFNILDDDIKRNIIDIAKHKYFLGLPKRIKLIYDYWSHPMAWYAINDFNTHVAYSIKYNYSNINSIISKNILNELMKK